VRLDAPYLKMQGAAGLQPCGTGFNEAELRCLGIAGLAALR